MDVLNQNVCIQNKHNWLDIKIIGCVSNFWFLCYLLKSILKVLNRRRYSISDHCAISAFILHSASFFFIDSLFFGLSHSLCVSLSKLPWSLAQCHRNIICLCLAIHLLGFFSSFRSNLGSLTSCATQFHSFSLEIAFMKFFVYCLCCECLHIISFDVIAVSGRSTKQYMIKQTISRQQWMLQEHFLEFILNLFQREQKIVC